MACKLVAIYQKYKKEHKDEVLSVLTPERVNKLLQTPNKFLAEFDLKEIEKLFLDTK